ncbi:MAG: hydrogenase maturation protease [Acidobacteria bacterium]|nr:hydrogenase maturation protease [Acidobacteriota bacterium]MCU0253938.1 hydrogenase maturation protease [Acidobacteriota bacterium]
MPAGTLLLGLGNPILGDDAIGLRLAALVAGRLEARGGLEDLEVIDDCSAGGLELLEPLAGRTRVVLVDAIVTGRAPPGTLHRFTAAALPSTRRLAGPHDADLATALALGRRLGLRLPRDEAIAIFAVEIEPACEFRATLSPDLQRAVPALAEEIAGEVRAALAATSPPPAAR